MPVSPAETIQPGAGPADSWGMTGLQTRAEDVTALHRSARDGSLELLYQPEIELASGTIVAMEGLLRWHHDGEVVAPGEFLDLAESAGAGGAIGHWVLETGAEEVAAWQGDGGRRQLWLNVSAGQAREAGFTAFVADLVVRHALPDGALGLELSETTLRALGADAEPLLTDLRAGGVALAVDDFASWYSVLGAMDLLPLSAVKLGQQHVRGVDQRGDEPIAAIVVRAAHERGLYVVAEGVETWAEASRLTDLGCDRAHGWVFASAQRADKARWLLSQGRGWRGSAVTPTTRARCRFGALTA